MAGFLTYGSGKALSYQHDYGKDIDRLYQRESYRAQVEAERARKYEYYASLMKQHAAATPFNVKRLEEFYSGLTGEVADFAMKHPKWNEDVMQSQQMFSIMDKFINNDIVREDIQVQAEFEKLKQAFNSGQITKTEYEDNAARYDKYKNEGGDPFVFANPKRVDFDDMVKTINDQLKGAQTDYTDPTTGKITRSQKTSDADIRSAVITSLADPENRRAAEKRYSEIPEEDRNVFKSLSDYMFHVVKLGEEYAALNAGYDEIYQYNARKAIDQEYKTAQSNRQYLTNVYEPLARGENVRPHDALIAFSSLGGKNNTVLFGDETGRGRTFKAYGKDNTISDLTIKGSAKAIGSAGMKTIGGVPYVGTTIQVLVNPKEASQEFLDKRENVDSSQLSAREQKRLRKQTEENQILEEATNQYMIQDLTDHGFVLSYEMREQILPTGGTNKGSVYVGTVWEPADLSEASRKAYDMAFGVSNSDVVDNTPSYSEDQNMIDAIKGGNIPVLNTIIESSLGWQKVDGDNENQFSKYDVPGTNNTFYFKKNNSTGQIEISYK